MTMLFVTYNDLVAVISCCVVVGGSFDGELLMLLSGYSDADSSSSSSGSEVDPIPGRRRSGTSSSSNSSGEEDNEDKSAAAEEDVKRPEGADDGSGLPSFDSVFEAVGEEDLTYKKFHAAKSREIAAFDLAKEREEARKRAEAQKRIEESQQVTDGGKVEGDEPREESARPTFSSMSKRERQDSQRYSSKDRTRLKRFKGQSGEDHAGRSWKPELWMKMRNDYD